jgi:hypothetical protein
MNMNPAIKQRWVAALKSGQYQQGRTALRYRDNFCCLGVLCDIAVHDGVARWSKMADDDYFCLDEAELPPAAVMAWAGLGTIWRDPYIDGHAVNQEGPIGLAQINDGETGRDYTFNEIADLIDIHL